MPQSLLHEGTSEEKGFICSSLYRDTFSPNIIINPILQKQVLSEQVRMIGMGCSV